MDTQCQFCSYLLGPSPKVDRVTTVTWFTFKVLEEKLTEQVHDIQARCNTRRVGVAHVSAQDEGGE